MYLARTPKIALIGNPNCGKTALFNAMTGGRAKIGNYPGVTVERKMGSAVTPSGLAIHILDLPGTYSLDARHTKTLDEGITRDVLLGRHKSETIPDGLIAVADATQLERSLALVIQLKALNQPTVLALNMMDLAQRRGLCLDRAVLSRELGIPVVATVAIQKTGISQLLEELQTELQKRALEVVTTAGPQFLDRLGDSSAEGVLQRFHEADRILELAVRNPSAPHLWTQRIDRVVLHPFWGSLLLVSILALVFQAIFSWSQIPMHSIASWVDWLGGRLSDFLPEGPLRSLMVEGVIAGVGSVLVFLPQILLLFFFILTLEDSGYMSRAAFLMDHLMGKVGLNGRAFIPLLSSFACAIPGIMAARTIENRRDRLTTILVAPLMTCSARLPIYTLLIGAFIPRRKILGIFELQALVMFGLYLAGVVSALGVAILLKKTLLAGPQGTLLLEMPTYKWPNLRNLSIGLLERAQLFVKKAGTVILAISILLWFVVSYPKPDSGELGAAISYSYAGRIGHILEPWVKPIGMNWKIVVALIPGFAAREVMIGSLATVYAVERHGNGAEGSWALLGDRIAKDWSLATALSLLVWYVLACQCVSTVVVTRRETNSWRWPAFMVIYMTALAYLGSFLTYQLARRLGWG